MGHLVQLLRKARLAWVPRLSLGTRGCGCLKLGEGSGSTARSAISCLGDHDPRYFLSSVERRKCLRGDWPPARPQPPSLLQEVPAHRHPVKTQGESPERTGSWVRPRCVLPVPACTSPYLSSGGLGLQDSAAMAHLPLGRPWFLRSHADPRAWGHHALSCPRNQTGSDYRGASGAGAWGVVGT